MRFGFCCGLYEDKGADVKFSYPRELLFIDEQL